MANLIRSVSKRRLRIVPDSSRSYAAENAQTDREFEVRVVNASNIFASFQIELSTSGIDPTAKIQWYSVEPEICSKKPPGAETKFRVVIHKAPAAGYGTTVPLTLHVFSVDAETLVDTQVLELEIEKPKRPLKVYLPLKDLKVYPGDRLDIPVLVYNLSPKFTQVALTLKDLDPDWFVQREVVKTVRVDAGDSQEVTFCCSPPRQTRTQSRVYEFSVEAEDQDQNTATFDSKLEVLPYGVVEFDCLEPSQTIPPPDAGDRDGSAAHYTFQFTNHSNLKQQISLKVLESDQPIPELDAAPLVLEPGAIATTAQTVERSRPWLGWQRHYRLEAVPLLTNAHSGEPSEPIYAEPNVQTLDLNVRPLIPVWLQLLCGGLALLASAVAWWFTAPKSPHAAPVSSVRIIGNETTVVSGASDQQVLRWDAIAFPWAVNARRLSYREKIAADTQNAVRVIREIPQREEQVAVGLENGEIQLWEVSSSKLEPAATIFDRNDRVFDLDFTPDSRYLFSGHGSGVVRRWRRSAEGFVRAQQLPLSGAISALAVVDLSTIGQPDRSLVAIAGQYDQFVLWDWQRNVHHAVSYGWDQVNPGSKQPPIQPVISKYDYINSVAVAKNAPVLAMADNRGFITLWDVKTLYQCIRDAGTPVAENPMQCDHARTQWQASDRGQSVRSVALSDDGCYLASAGDDGRVRLWTIPPQPDRASAEPPDSTTVAAFPEASLRTVDIEHPASNYVLVAFDAPENQVKLYRQRVNADACPAIASARQP